MVAEVVVKGGRVEADFCIGIPRRNKPVRRPKCGGGAGYEAVIVRPPLPFTLAN
jgi:hypothetical protein